MDENRVMIIEDAGPPPGRRRLGWYVAAAIVILAAGTLAAVGLSGGSDPAQEARPSTTTTTTETTTTSLDTADPAQLEYEADIELISQLWWDQSVAWASGFSNGVGFWVENNYPDMGCSFDDYMASWFPDGPVEGLVVERNVNVPTIARDEGWLIPGGKLAGVPAKGRVYVMAVSDRFITPDVEPEPPTIRSFHVTIIDGQAHFFISCLT